MQHSQADPHPSHSDNETGSNDSDLLDPLAPGSIINNDHGTPDLLEDQTLYITSYTAPQSDINDSELDDMVLRLRRHFRRAGISMLDGMLHRLGYRIPRERIRQSLLRIDPVHCIFQRIHIRRRVYNVPGPNSLWHHDGQHGMLARFLLLKNFLY